jgi:hypothetical protein
LRLDATVALIPGTIAVSSSSVAAGDSLADAVRRINDGDEVLAEARRESDALARRASLREVT